MSNETPTLADLIALWVVERGLNVRIEGPDDFYSSLYYIDSQKTEAHPNSKWIADIDNSAGEVFLRVNKEVMIILDATDPEFFAVLETHVKTSIENYEY